MPGPSIPWKTLETEAWRTQIDSVPPARYKLASPRTITGSPSFAMQSADQHCVVRVYIGAGKAPDLSLTVSGTTPVPMTNAVGGNLTAQELADLRIEVGMPQPGFTLLTTDEPNGSPSAPFTTVDERTAWATANLASLLPGRTTAWGPGASTECVWVGPLATDWQGIRGPYLGSAENPFPDAAALPASGPYVGYEAALANALAPRGYTWLYWTGSRWAISPDQTLACFDNDDGSLLQDLQANLLTVGATQEIWFSPALPRWFFGSGGFAQQLRTFVELGQSDLSSIASGSLFFSLRTAPYTANDVFGQISGYSGAMTTSPRGFAAAFSQITAVPAGGIIGREGVSQNVGAEVEKTIGDWDASTTRARISWRPGASTNRNRIRRIIIKSGDC